MKRRRNQGGLPPRVYRKETEYDALFITLTGALLAGVLAYAVLILWPGR